MILWIIAMVGVVVFAIIHAKLEERNPTSHF